MGGPPLKIVAEGRSYWIIVSNSWRLIILLK